MEFDGPVIVPDSWEPVLGYRMFHLAGGNPLLQSTGISASSFWQPGVNVAECKKLSLSLRYIDEEWPEEPPAHEAPDPDCRCGFYALKSAQLLLDHFQIDSWHPGQESVWAKVAMWGTVIEGTDGYRAQYAKVMEILGTPMSLTLAQQVGVTYGVDVSLELLVSHAWFIGGPAHGRIIPAHKIGAGSLYRFPIVEPPKVTQFHRKLRLAPDAELRMMQAVYQRDGRAQVWRFRGYQR